MKIKKIPHFQNQISKSLNEAKSIPRTHKYMTVYEFWMGGITGV
jgi:hypothetical protein